MEAGVQRVQRAPVCILKAQSVNTHTHTCRMYWWENGVDEMINYTMAVKMETRHGVILNERLNIISAFPKIW